MENKELKESYIDERTGIEYRLVGDYYLPNIVLPKSRRTGNIGKYGRLRLKYLEEHHRAEVMLMRVNNELTSHLLDIEDECKSRVGQLVKQMAEKENITEELKANNQMLWVQSMNNIKNRAEEIAYNEIIYK
ncbi:MAG TPA: TnpV protein [Clostridiales bacterium]|nr:TnpV protein [Clostridiales bacterium]